jgi:bacterioferritin-associated ferredoxin
MYVCLCNAVTDKAIRKAIQQHQPETMKELRQHCPIGTDCGKCIRQAREILLQEQENITYIIEVA